WYPNNRIVGYLWSLTAVSLAAQALTTPPSLYLFKAFPVWFLPANLVVVYVAGIAVYGAVALLVFFRVPYLGPLITFGLSFLLMVVDRVTLFFAQLPGAYPSIRITFLDMLLFYAITFLIAVRLLWKRRAAGRLAWGCVALFLLGWGYRARQASEVISFTVYDDRQAVQAAMRVGRELTVLNAAGDTLSPWLAQKVERHARAQGLNVPSVIGQDLLQADAVRTTGNTIVGSGLWAAPGLEVYFHNGTSGAPTSMRSDVVVLHDLRYLGDGELEALATGTGQVVLAGGLPWKLRAFVRKWCTARGIPCHDVRDHGAFVLERRIG
ncbi:MAG: ComEC/Rec2 family competence protein, partial [Flavobacteriales bacterium]